MHILVHIGPNTNLQIARPYCGTASLPLHGVVPFAKQIKIDTYESMHSNSCNTLWVGTITGELAIFGEVPVVNKRMLKTCLKPVQTPESPGKDMLDIMSSFG